ncbi:MAG: type II toxin-antitoxin system VapC family toxin [Betaproteobacteria bacterium]
MRSALLDTGALVALINRRDRFHTQLVDLLRRYDGRFLTTWPVVAEACSFMSDKLQSRVLDWVATAPVEVVSIDDGLESMRQTMTDYADLPCDFADASLIYAAAKTGVREVWTLDRDFLVFRLPDRGRFRLIPGGA